MLFCRFLPGSLGQAPFLNSLSQHSASTRVDAVAGTGRLESEAEAQEDGGLEQAGPGPGSAALAAAEMDEKEKLRRNRISQANSGKTPWNKGRKHSPGEF